MSASPTIRGSILTWLAVVLLLLLGLGIRLYDLTDPPIDFHPTRQLRGAIIARGIYYEMLPDADPQTRRLATGAARTPGQYEPPILETLVAYTYLVIGGENFWVARIYNSIFWIIAALALFDLVRRMTSPGGGLVAMAYFLLLPFAAQASRSFQPDPGMTMWVVLAVYMLYRWSREQKWRWAILAGILAGIAILTKPVAVYLVAGAAVAIVPYTLGFNRFWKSFQGWLMFVLMVFPPALYYLSQHEGGASDYFTNWTLALSHLIVSPAFYMRWLSFVQSLLGFLALLLALTGVLVSTPREKTLLLGLWAGYFIYGLTLPYQMYTHSYYHIQLVPIIAISLAPIAQLVSERLARQGKLWQVLFTGVALIGIVFPSWVAVTTLAAEDHRQEPAYWQKIGSLLPTDGKIIALTQDYGYTLQYYGWRKVALWPTSGEQELAELRNRDQDFAANFTGLTLEKDYFLITAFRQFEEQSQLKAFLFENYPVFAEGKGYLIFDLRKPLTP